MIHPRGFRKRGGMNSPKNRTRKRPQNRKRLYWAKNNGSKYFCWKVCMNSRGLKIHQSRMKCVSPHSDNDLVGRRRRPSRNQTTVIVIISMWLRVRLSTRDNLHHTEEGNRKRIEVSNHREEHEPRRSNDQTLQLGRFLTMIFRTFGRRFSWIITAITSIIYITWKTTKSTCSWS